MLDEVIIFSSMSTVTVFMLTIIWVIFKERTENRKMNFKKWAMKYERKNPKIGKGASGNNQNTATGTEKNTTGLVDLLSNLDGDKIKALIGAFGDKTYDVDEDEPTQGGMMDGILEYAKDHPDVVAKFLSGLTDKKEQPPTNLY